MEARYYFKCLATSLILCISNFAIADVNIIYPFDGASHPKANPGPLNIDSYYLPISIAISCEGGPHRVQWQINGEVLGTANFYDQITVQQIYKVAGGGHVLRVDTDDPKQCGS